MSSPAQSPAAELWRTRLAGWRIPDEILAQAPQSPWIHPVELFVTNPGPIPDSPSHQRAREAVPEGGSVLDVGCGGGRAALATIPPAGRVIGVDHQPAMLDAFAAAAEGRRVQHQEVLGLWPDAAPSSPAADVVVCHHVAYNVADMTAFALALDEHAERRVVLEVPERHPLAAMAPLWQEFWGLDRPEGPSAQDLLDVLLEAGLPARTQPWTETTDRGLDAVPWQRQVEFMRIRLCLPSERDADVAAALTALGPIPPRRMATIWWDHREPGKS